MILYGASLALSPVQDTRPLRHVSAPTIELRAHIHGLMKAPKKTAKKRPHSGNIPAAVHL